LLDEALRDALVEAPSATLLPTRFEAVDLRDFVAIAASFVVGQRCPHPPSLMRTVKRVKTQ
jgi:hypothetical protein